MIFSKGPDRPSLHFLKINPAKCRLARQYRMEADGVYPPERRVDSSREADSGPAEGAETQFPRAGMLPVAASAALPPPHRSASSVADRLATC